MKRDLIGRFLLDGVDYTNTRQGLIGALAAAVACLALIVEKL